MNSLNCSRKRKESGLTKAVRSLRVRFKIHEKLGLRNKSLSTQFFEVNQLFSFILDTMGHKLNFGSYGGEYKKKKKLFELKNIQKWFWSVMMYARGNCLYFKLLLSFSQIIYKIKCSSP